MVSCVVSKPMKKQTIYSYALCKSSGPHCSTTTDEPERDRTDSEIVNVNFITGDPENLQRLTCSIQELESLGYSASLFLMSPFPMTFPVVLSTNRSVLLIFQDPLPAAKAEIIELNVAATVFLCLIIILDGSC